jgi:hypothetical protein
LCAQKRPGQVRRDYPVPAFQGCVEDVIALLESGVVDQNVYATEPFVRSCKEPSDLVAFGNVATDSPRRVLATCIELTDDLVSTPSVGTVVHHDLSARGMQRPDDLGSDPS